jgi:deazaflavin-dependent oxidoreductase (nitroreductase family)
MSDARKPPSGVLKWLLRLPGAMYRSHAGWLFGHRLLMLRHQGRVSGLVRDTVLEVVHRDAASHESFVVSGWGRQAAWFRNIEAGGALEVWVASKRFVPEYRVVAGGEALQLMQAYVDEHRLAAKVVGKWLGFELGKPGEIERLVQELPVLAFRPKRPTVNLRNSD